MYTAQNMIERISQYKDDISKAKNIQGFTERCATIREVHINFRTSLSEEELAAYLEKVEIDFNTVRNSATNTKYKEYLSSITWKKIKKKVINRASGCCEGCGNSEPLEVHHLTYERVGMELMTDLSALCRNCHLKAHGKAVKSDWNLYLNGEANKPLVYEDMTDDKILDYIASM